MYPPSGLQIVCVEPNPEKKLRDELDSKRDECVTSLCAVMVKKWPRRHLTERSYPVSS